MIRVVIIGVGNCASSLVQGIHFYKDKETTDGLVRKDINGYKVDSINIVGAIDVDSRKVGKDVSEAILAGTNVARKFVEVPHYGVPVVKGNVLDGVASHMEDRFKVDAAQEIVDVAEYLKSVKADMAVSYLPVGSENATRFYAAEALKAKVAFINAIPVFVCSTDEWSDQFKKAGVPIAGDDIKSQFGATYLNRILVEGLMNRGFSIGDLYQLNVGGNTDFENMIDESRLTNKRISKTDAVGTLFDTRNKEIPALRIGPSDFVPHLKDTKICYININGTQFGDQPFELELKLKVEDSPNSAGIMMDVIRLLKVAKDRGMGGNIEEVSSFGFKHPMHKHDEKAILDMIDKFLAG